MSSTDPRLKRESFRGYAWGIFIIWASLMEWLCTTLGPSMKTRYIIAAVGSAVFGMFALWIANILGVRKTRHVQAAVGIAAIGMFLLSIANILGVVPKETAIAQTSTPSNQNCTGNCSFNQSGGTVIQNYNQEPKRLEFNENLANALLSKITTTSKPVLLRGVGGAKDQEIVQQYARFFENHGHQVSLFTIGMLIPPPDEKIGFLETSTNYQITLAPSAF